MAPNRPPRIGVILSAGSSRGIFAHTGFLLALEQMGIPVSAAAGCSAGAVVGGIAASGTDLKVWANAICHIKREEFWTPDPVRHVIWSMARNRGIGYSGLSDTAAAINFFRRNLTAQTFEDCRYPLYIMAINLDQAEKTVFSHGELAPRMMASAAMPILYKPVNIDGRYYSDGALIELAPVDNICCKHGLDALIVHQIGQRFGRKGDMSGVLQQPWSLLEIVNRLLFHQRPWYLSNEELGFKRCRCGCGAAVVVLEPELPELHWPHTKGGAKILEAARQKTETLLRRHLEALLTDPRQRLPTPPADLRPGQSHGTERCTTNQ
jgi:predicted acylesterase/phospholipase RssA